MQASILIVSKNRKEELELTLNVLAQMIDFSIHEVLVFLDGCTDGSSVLKNNIDWVKWYSSEINIGASAARHQLYPKAKGKLLIGLDDDSHPMHSDFIEKISTIFNKQPNVGIVSFKEVKGIFASDSVALVKSESPEEEYLTNDFKGCGFAVRKDVYDKTNGFPVWIDIYGEESCLAIEVLALGFDILYSNLIKVNHRVNIEERKLQMKNYFRFGKQLKNTTYYFLVYYPFPLISILKLYWHNFKKYALTDWECFKIYFRILLTVLFGFISILKYRSPVDKSLILKMRKLSALKY